MPRPTGVCVGSVVGVWSVCGSRWDSVCGRTISWLSGPPASEKPPMDKMERLARTQLKSGTISEGVGRPAAWWRTSHDVLARLMFSSRADSFSPANRLHPLYQRANSIVPGAGSLSRIVYNNHHSFTYAASVAERNGLKPSGSDPASGVPPAANHGLKPRGSRRVQTVSSGLRVFTGGAPRDTRPVRARSWRRERR